MFRTVTSVLDVCRFAATVTGNAAATAGELAGSLAGAARDAAEAAVREGVEGVREGVEGVREGVEGVRDIGPERGHRRVWSSGGHATIEVRGLVAGGRVRKGLAAEVRRAVSGLRGVRWAEINAVTAQVLVAFEDGSVDVGQLVDVVSNAEHKHGTQDEGFGWSAPDHPADTAAAVANATALIADLAGAGAGLAGRLAKLAPVPAAVRVPLSVIDSYPKLRGPLEKAIGPMAADVVLAVGNSAVHALADGPARPAVDAVYRTLLAREMAAARSAWQRGYADIAGTPEDFAAPPPRTAGERPRPIPAGPVETYSGKIAAGSLAAVGGVFAATRAPGRTAEALNATVPKAAQLGREGFAAVLAGDLARRGVIPMDRSAFRRLDRVSVVVIDSAVLIGDRPQVLSAEAADGRDEAEVWHAVTTVLREVPADELAGTGPWHAGRYLLSREGAQGRRPDHPDGLRLMVRDGDEVIGAATVGCEPDPLAEAVLAAARSGGARLHVRRHASLAELVSGADDVIEGGLARHVRGLQADGEGVLLVAAGDNGALAAADVAVGYLREGGSRPVGWAGDLICGPGLREVWRILRAAARARSVSEKAVAVAAGGAALGLLEATVARRGSAVSSLSPLGHLPVGAVQAASLTGLGLGAATARSLSREAEPVPAPRVAWHAMSAEDVLARLDAARAAQPDGTEDGGGTRIRQLPGAGLPRSVLSELRDPLTPVLVIGSVASAMLGSAVDAGLVGGVTAGNALISGAQRLRTERALRGLLLGEQRSARRVPREPGAPLPGEGPAGDSGDEPRAETVSAAELRPGDIIALRADDVVPADARLLAADNLETDDSALTGESLPVAKDPAPTVTAQLAERTCMVYEGTTVVSGTALAVVVATSDATEAGRAAAIASAAGAGQQPGGVSARLSELTSAALPATAAGGIAVTALGLLRGTPLREALSAGVAVAVAAVPEGLPLVATVAQLAAARRLSKRGVLVRSSRTLEALSRVDVVCFDKTGTLTEGRLKVAAVAEPGRDLGLDDDQARSVLRVAARACPDPAGTITHATDRAILDASGEAGWELIEQVPFQNNRGFSASVGRHHDGKVTLAVKGAPEVVLDACRLASSSRRDAERTTERLAGRGLRVLAVAEGEAPGAGDDVTALPGDLRLRGFVAIADVMRPGTAEVIAELSNSGARPVMITGDHPETASAIAAEAGIPDAGAVITGPELDRMPERRRRETVAAATVFARVTPEHKLRIVSDLRRAGRVVAMVGDGANDAAAIRMADVGIGVEAHGSTAARNSADLVLANGGIGRISDALSEGRGMWSSVQAAVSILVGGNAGEVAFMVLGTALGGRSPLNTRQLLLVNMLTDMFPALAVAGTQRPGGEPAVQTSFTGPFGRSIAIRGGATALGATLAWAGGRLTGRRGRASTMGLAAVVATQLAQTLVTGGRSPTLIATCVASAAALVLVVNTPGISQFFGCTPLGPAAWGIVAASALAATVIGVWLQRLQEGK